jgi:AcrR family transcriptional regulator
MRRALLAAALEAFAEHGYEATSVRDLARRVGVSHNLVHHHYGSKWQLWQTALEHALASSGRELFALVEASDRERDWEVANRAGITGAVLLFARQPAFARILADESARGGARLDFLYDRYIAPFAGLLEGLLDGAPPNVKRRIDARAALLFLFAGLTAPFALGGLAAKLDGAHGVGEDDLRRFATTVAEIVAHGLSPARGTPRRRPGRTATGG